MPRELRQSVRTGRRYRRSRLADRYDAVVIGSGMGGLTTAALLGDLGWRVCVLEQHYTAGGYTHSYERHGYEWDVGVHYIGDVGARTRTRRMFDYLTDGRLRWAPMADEYDRFYVGDRVYNAMAGREAFRDNLVRQFPAQVEAIDRYLQCLQEAAGGMRDFAMHKALPRWARAMTAPLRRTRTSPIMYRTTLEVLRELTGDRDLIAVLCGQWGDMGLPPGRSAFMLHAMIARHYLYGGYYPVGGSWRIADAVLPKIRAAGGEVFTYATVTGIECDGRRVSGVTLADGHRIPCRTVISSAGVDNTFSRLLPGAAAARAGYTKGLAAVRPSLGHLCLYIGLAMTAEEAGLPQTNYWIYPHNDYDRAVDAFLADPAAPFPVVYISFPSAKDPEYLDRHPGTATIEIVAPAPYAWFEQWAGTTWGQRGADYLQLKDALRDRLLAALFDKLPQLRGRIDYCELSTPLSTRWFSGWRHGELYGLEHSVDRLRQDWLRPKTRIDGLWLTGQDVLTCGVTGAMMAGLLTVSAMIGPRRSVALMKRVFG